MQLRHSLTSYLTPTCCTVCLYVNCRCDLFRSQLLAIFKELAIFFSTCAVLASTYLGVIQVSGISCSGCERIRCTLCNKLVINIMCVFFF